MVLKIVEGLMIGERRVVSKDKTWYAASMMVRVMISASEEGYVDVWMCIVRCSLCEVLGTAC